MKMVDADVINNVIAAWITKFYQEGRKPDVYDLGFIFGLKGIQRVINKMPGEERQHGHWIKIPVVYGMVRCSACSTTFVCIEERWNYCPHCGAKMDEA